MRTEFLPFSRPPITEDKIATVADIMCSVWITTGPWNSLFEQRICEYSGCQGVMALKAINIEQGDKHHEHDHEVEHVQKHSQSQ